MGLLRSCIFWARMLGLFLCLPIFLLLAYGFVHYSPVRYQATARLYVRNIGADSVIRALRSPALISGVIKSSSLQTSYFDPSSQDELFVDSLPVKVKFYAPYRGNEDLLLTIKAGASESYDLVNVDTVMPKHFGDTVDEWYGRFRIDHNPAKNMEGFSCIIRLRNITEAVYDYANLLKTGKGDGNTITISIVTGNAQKSVKFVNGIINAYRHRCIADAKTASLLDSKSAGLSALHPPHLLILEKPGDNIESAGWSPLLIYTLATLFGLLPAAAWWLIKRRGDVPLTDSLISLRRFAERLNDRIFAVKQID